MKIWYNNYPMTMTVKELIDKLSEFPDDMPVLATWEGISVAIRPENFSVFRNLVGHDNSLYKEATLLIDVDN